MPSSLGLVLILVQCPAVGPVNEPCWPVGNKKTQRPCQPQKQAHVWHD